jgi:ABC-type antimicrobial peptide transport system permease subunit
LDASINVWNSLDSQSTFDTVKKILNIIFSAIIAITMFLCFFSLSSSMSANLYEQSKELGILRAIGFKSSRIIMLYIYEAFILVISSSILGVLIGTLVGFTMTL